MERRTLILLILAVVLLGGLCLVMANIDSWTTPGDNGDGYESYVGRDLEAIKIDGKTYDPKDITSFLLIGIDETVPISETEDRFPSADFLVLVTLNHTDKTYSFLHINRDTMTDVWVIDGIGRRLGTTNTQIALAYAKGNNTREACLNTVTAVSDLLYGMPISDYFCMTMGGVSVLNDTVGGKGVTLTLDKDYPEFGEEYAAGAEVTLIGADALNFVRARGKMQTPTNLARMERQKLYIEALLRKLLDANLTLADFMNYRDKLDPYLYISPSASYNKLYESYSQLAEYSPCGEKYIYDIAGEAVEGEYYIEYVYDPEALKKLMIKLYYDERR